MSDERAIGDELCLVLGRINLRLERLELRHARAEGLPVDMNAVDEARIDVDVACDRLGDDVQSAIERAFSKVAAELKRKMTEG